MKGNPKKDHHFFPPPSLTHTRKISPPRLCPKPTNPGEFRPEATGFSPSQCVSDVLVGSEARRASLLEYAASGGAGQRWGSRRSTAAPRKLCVRFRRAGRGRKGDLGEGSSSNRCPPFGYFSSIRFQEKATIESFLKGEPFPGSDPEVASGNATSKEASRNAVCVWIHFQEVSHSISFHRGQFYCVPHDFVGGYPWRIVLCGLCFKKALPEQE